MIRRQVIALALFGMPVLAFASVARADESSVIGDSALRNVTGITAVNQAAGDENLQVNAAAIAATDRGAALATVVAIQQHDRPSDGTAGAFVAKIEDRAFAGAEGLHQVNQAAGHGNLQANLAVIAVGGVAVADAVLSQTRPESSAGSSGGGAGANGAREASVEAGAFRGLTGVIQVNQTAGLRNASANQFALVVASGADF